MTTPPYRLLMLDIDGTLLNEQGQITPRTRRAVAAAQSAGVVVVLATARRYFSASQFAPNLRLNAPVASYDGALIRLHPSGERWHSDPLPAVVGQAAVDAITRHGLQPMAQYALDDGEHILTGYKSGDTPWSGVYFDIYADQLERRPLHELCTGGHDPLRIVVFGPPDRLEQIATDRKSTRLNSSHI